MLNKITFEFDDDELVELREMIRKLSKGHQDVTLKLNGTLRGLAKTMEKEINIYDDFKKRDMW